VLLQQEMTGHVLAGRVLGLVADRQRRQRIAAAASRWARPHAARVIVDRALELVNR
jgi:UDP-N-acetylglucosamine:LPS N-acetylglucosamine transferase